MNTRIPDVLERHAIRIVVPRLKSMHAPTATPISTAIVSVGAGVGGAASEETGEPLSDQRAQCRDRSGEDGDIDLDGRVDEGDAVVGVLVGVRLAEEEVVDVDDSDDADDRDTIEIPVSHKPCVGHSGDHPSHTLIQGERHQ